MRAENLSKRILIIRRLILSLSKTTLESIFLNQCYFHSSTKFKIVEQLNTFHKFPLGEGSDKHTQTLRKFFNMKKSLVSIFPV